MADTSIEWATKSWNPTRGCDVYSKECINCYAMRFAHRFSGKGGKYEGLTKLTKAGPVWTGEVRPIPKQLGAPLQWKKPERVFVDSMSDLFYGDEADEKRAVQRGVPFAPVPFEYVMTCFEVMTSCPHHTFLILTKRPARMLHFLRSHQLSALPNVLLGASVGYQGAADERRAPMAEIAALGWRTWVSYEPALWSVDWYGWEFIRWLVGGYESGYGRREARDPWFEAARAWCDANDIAFFMKQIVAPSGKKIAFDKFPRSLQVRNYPER